MFGKREFGGKEEVKPNIHLSNIDSDGYSVN